MTDWPDRLKSFGFISTDSAPHLLKCGVRIPYVYVLFDCFGSPFYVGKGSGNRALRHEVLTSRGNTQKNVLKFQAIKEIQNRGLLVAKFIKQFDSVVSALEFEVFLIAQIGRAPDGPLFNITGGGDGVVDLSSDAHARMVAAQRVAFNKPDQKSARSSRSKAWHADPEKKEKHRGAVMAAYADPDKKARHSSALAKVRERPNYGESISKQFSALYSDPEYKERHRLAMKLASSTPEAKERLSRAAQVRWARARALKVSSSGD